MLLSQVIGRKTALLLGLVAAVVADNGPGPILHAPRSAQLEPLTSTADEGVATVHGQPFRITGETRIHEADAESMQLILDPDTVIAKGDLLRIVPSSGADVQVYDAAALRRNGFQSDYVDDKNVTVQLLTPVVPVAGRQLAARQAGASRATVASVKRALPMKPQPEHSDEFDYSGKSQAFEDKWLDNHRSGWDGPGDSLFDSARSDVRDGTLIVEGRRAADGRVGCGYVTSKTPVNFPVYTEVSMKASGLKLSSNFWLLSEDDVNEIDVIEVYGNEADKGKEMGTNFHIFQREPFKDLANHGRGYFANGVQASNKGMSTADGADQPLLRDDFHRYGVYWKSATEFEFYLDGQLVRTLNKDNDLQDPRNRFFDQPMHLILNTESHAWRVADGITPTDAELADDDINNVYYQWIRTFK